VASKYLFLDAELALFQPSCGPGSFWYACSNFPLTMVCTCRYFHAVVMISPTLHQFCIEAPPCVSHPSADVQEGPLIPLTPRFCVLLRPPILPTPDRDCCFPFFVLTSRQVPLVVLFLLFLVLASFQGLPTPATGTTILFFTFFLYQKPLPVHGIFWSRHLVLVRVAETTARCSPPPPSGLSSCPLVVLFPPPPKSVNYSFFFTF